MIVLDTGVLLYWLFSRTELSPAASQAIQTAETILISSISIWEIAIKVKKNKLLLPITPRALSVRLQGVYKIETVPVSESIWLASVDLAWTHRDPADRVIVATAQERGCPLATQDLEIRGFLPSSVW
jgi:PIN domain nuclease of toxin-antitoxin system